MKHGKKAFSLAEITIAITIIGIMAGIGIPVYLGHVEQAREQEAVANLMMIYTAEMTYRFNNPSAASAQAAYWPPSGTVSDISAINSNLNLTLEEKFYDLSVRREEGNPGGFEATAVRVGGGKTFTITQGGVLVNDGPPPGGSSGGS